MKHRASMKKTAPPRPERDELWLTNNSTRNPLQDFDATSRTSLQKKLNDEERSEAEFTFTGMLAEADADKAEWLEKNAKRPKKWALTASDYQGQAKQSELAVSSSGYDVP